MSREFILKAHPTGIINIVDATNLERNLYLTMQLMELGVPMVLALNMMDEVTNNGGTILVNILEQRLGIPVVPISAMRDEGVDELIDHAIHVFIGPFMPWLILSKTMPRLPASPDSLPPPNSWRATA